MPAIVSDVRRPVAGLINVNSSPARTELRAGPPPMPRNVGRHDHEVARCEHRTPRGFVGVEARIPGRQGGNAPSEQRLVEPGQPLRDGVVRSTRLGTRLRTAPGGLTCSTPVLRLESIGVHRIAEVAVDAKVEAGARGCREARRLRLEHRREHRHEDEHEHDERVHPEQQPGSEPLRERVRQAETGSEPAARVRQSPAEPTEPIVVRDDQDDRRQDEHQALHEEHRDVAVVEHRRQQGEREHAVDEQRGARDRYRQAPRHQRREQRHESQRDQRRARAAPRAGLHARHRPQGSPRRTRHRLRRGADVAGCVASAGRACRGWRG